MKELILGYVEDLIAAFLYYDRKEDEDLQRGDIEKAIKDGLITEAEIVEQFSKCLHKGLA